MKRPKTITDLDRRMARVCVHCMACKRARKQQRGLFHWFVSKIESRVCPFCRAYERVHGRKAHEPLPGKAG
jgi:hypothetical protein